MSRKPKLDYKNWVPRGLLWALGAGTIFCLAGFVLFLVCDLGLGRAARIACLCLWFAALLACAFFLAWMTYLHRAFSFTARRALARRIVEGVAARVTLPDGGLGLDVGCGSGALTIACARRNPRARMLGVDRWGAEYSTIKKRLCEDNAEAEGIGNISFRNGSAISLNYPDETFDAVTSNLVYHNIHCRDRKELLLETLRVLKKGGVFALHDIMSPAAYGNMQEFVRELQDAGYQKVELIDTADDVLIPAKDAWKLGMRHAKLLAGVR